MYTNKRTALASPAKGGAPIPKDVERMSRKSLGAPMEETRKETETPYARLQPFLGRAGPPQGIREGGSEATNGSH